MYNKLLDRLEAKRKKEVDMTFNEMVKELEEIIAPPTYVFTK